MFEFEQWTVSDIVAGLAGAAALTYLFYEIRRRQAQLRDLINTLDDEDVALTRELEQLVNEGKLVPFPKARTA